MLSSMPINPDWPYIISLAIIAACGYAAFVVWRVNHPRYRRYWHSNVWLLVAGGNMLIAATAGVLVGMDAFLGLMILNTMWGLPMIVAVVMSNERHEAERDDETDATR